MDNKTHADRATLEVAWPQDDAIQITVGGNWSIYSNCIDAAAIYHQLATASQKRLTFDTQDLKQWDSSLLTFLAKVKRKCQKFNIEVDDSGLPEGMKKLLVLGAVVPKNNTPKKKWLPWLAQIGEQFFETLRSGKALLIFIGETFINIGKLIRGKASFRHSDFWLTVQQCGVGALPIVTIISFLVGTILAFVGAIQLQKFGAGIYVANLVGLGMTREMGAMMTAIVMTGRTGAAFAAQLGTMTINEEIDALKTFGFSPMEFLVLPRVLALVLMMPLLCLYANFVGIIGGAAVSGALFGISFTQYFTQLSGAVSLADFAVGMIKSVIFALLVALAGCLRGIQCGRTAAAVGSAVTSAVVTGIVLIIVFDAIFTVMFNAIGM